ncbi:hypothetical protein, partial [Paenibacillus helianthi]|uniref:hypothetical protein n=1 Tax=Paenibacillus helianthi TaxID=1349432 RepID=UPI001160FFB7
MEGIYNLVNDMKDKAQHIQKYYEIALLTNSRSKTRIFNNQPFDYSENNEFFSDQEFSEILEGIQSAGYYV